ncbi:Proline-rich protein [Labilithrix luteola]|uniref:Proline-rich protein n=1 Tax=Labilithrix luteola TaxID=1391654 RepID=A0A0K1Q9P8_9BACT|nr:DUF296 domain-containing protein [Labilithrix luteola]AKV02464.1 Proline-rich protein [Labilithrix luteola]
MTVSTANARHILVRLDNSVQLPAALLDVLRDEIVTCGWLRASGVLTDVSLRSFDPDTGMPGAERRLTGPVHAVVIDGSVGLAGGDVSCGLRVVLSRETDNGIETIAGEIESARAVAVEVLVTAFDDVAATRQRHTSGIALLDATTTSPRVSAVPAPEPAPAPAPAPVAAPEPAPAPAPAPVAAPEPAPAPAPAPTWAETIRVSEEASAPPPPPAPAPAPAASNVPKPSPTFMPGALGNVMPRPVKVTKAAEEEQPYPEPGDIVDHFAFGRCEVIKSDGDRLHLRLGKDGRVKEIALEMLKITLMPPEEGQTGRLFKLARKL